MPGLKQCCNQKKRGKEEYSYTAFHMLYRGMIEPDWESLPGVVKRELCRIVRWPYNILTHDPERFYGHLHKVWRKANKEGKSSVENVDCAVCLDTYKLDGKDKVTTLMCGHHFCSRCIFRHIESHRERSSCPLCRANVFQVPERVETENNEELETKRERRRLERWKKHQRKKAVVSS